MSVNTPEDWVSKKIWTLKLISASFLRKDYQITWFVVKVIFLW